MATKRNTKTSRIHLHVENYSPLGEVFEASRKRINDALRDHPKLKGRMKITVGYDGDIFDRAIRSAEILFGWEFDRENLAERAPKLRWVHAHGAGVNHLMPLDWLPTGATLTNSRGVHGAKADEYTIMALLMLNNRVPEMVANQCRAKWYQPFNTSIEGKTLLVVGVGHIGSGAAKWAQRFGMHVIGIRRSGKPNRYVDEMYHPRSLHRQLPRADFVLITVPHTDATHHLIGKSELDLMKPGAGLVNYSRAQLVDYEALRKKLNKGELSAVLDVFDPEPLPASSPLWKTPNLVITPHSSSDDQELYTPKTLDLLFNNIERYVDRLPLKNVVSRRYQY